MPKLASGLCSVNGRAGDLRLLPSLPVNEVKGFAPKNLMKNKQLYRAVERVSAQVPQTDRQSVPKVSSIDECGWQRTLSLCELSGTTRGPGAP